MEIDLGGTTAALVGAHRDVARIAFDALRANGAAAAKATALPDILLAAFDLVDPGDDDGAAAFAEIGAVGRAMRERGHGRIVFLVSVLGVVPSRRNGSLSARAAAQIASARHLAMTLAPQVLVNVVAAGLVEESADTRGIVAGDASMLSHVPIARAGRSDEIANAVLFLCDPANTYTTGHVLIADGGWSAGYARDF